MATAWTRCGSKGALLMKRGCMRLFASTKDPYCQLADKQSMQGMARRVFYLFVLILCLMGLRLERCQARSPFRVRPLEFALPSAAPSGNPIDDQIWGTFYPAVQS